MLEKVWVDECPASMSRVTAKIPSRMDEAARLQDRRR
jgi:hypothetical protein